MGKKGLQQVFKTYSFYTSTYTMNFLEGLVYNN